MVVKGLTIVGFLLWKLSEIEVIFEKWGRAMLSMSIILIVFL